MKPLLLMVCLCCSVAAFSQKFFPDRCLGTWEGWMLIYSKGILKDSVMIRRTVNPIDSLSWTWKTDYLSTKMPMTKDYILRAKDRTGIEYITDEGEGITIAMHLTGNRLTSIFETHGVLLTASEELTPDGLLFEVVSSKQVDARDAEVINYQVNAVQRALLKRVAPASK